jgi:hypothetical protein
MRRLLIKLVAIETMLVGWLSYWLFLVYANNPTVSAGLGEQLSKFPQLAFTTVDIAVLVIIGAFAITLAFKFHRGLRPGIRLERALQMLENLMKRNLVLEAQVAELRVDKVEKIRSGPLQSSSSISTSSFSGQSSSASGGSSTEPRLGSWEKAFRTPLEAGSATTKVGSSRQSEVPFEHETGIPPPRIEPIPPPKTAKPPLIISDKPDSPSSVVNPAEKSTEKPFASTSSSASIGWEDSPKYVGETMGILTPSTAPKKIPSFSSDSSAQNPPYIPVAVSRVPPPSVIVGPMNQKPSSSSRQSPRPIVRPLFPTKPTSKDQAASLPTADKNASLPDVLDKPERSADVIASEPPKIDTTFSDAKDKPNEKPSPSTKKQFPYEED